MVHQAGFIIFGFDSISGSVLKYYHSTLDGVLPHHNLGSPMILPLPLTSKQPEERETK